MLPRAMFVDIRAKLWLGTMDRSMALLLWGHWKWCDYSGSLLPPRTILGFQDHANAGIRQIWKACAATRVHGDIWAQAVSSDLVWICGPATVGLSVLMSNCFCYSRGPHEPSVESCFEILGLCWAGFTSHWPRESHASCQPRESCSSHLRADHAPSCPGENELQWHQHEKPSPNLNRRIAFHTPFWKRALSLTTSITDLAQPLAWESGPSGLDSAVTQVYIQWLKETARCWRISCGDTVLMTCQGPHTYWATHCTMNICKESCLDKRVYNIIHRAPNVTKTNEEAMEKQRQKSEVVFVCFYFVCFFFVVGWFLFEMGTCICISIFYFTIFFFFLIFIVFFIISF